MFRSLIADILISRSYDDNGPSCLLLSKTSVFALCPIKVEIWVQFKSQQKFAEAELKFRVVWLFIKLIPENFCNEWENQFGRIAAQSLSSHAKFGLFDVIEGVGIRPIAFVHPVEASVDLVHQQVSQRDKIIAPRLGHSLEGIVACEQQVSLEALDLLLLNVEAFNLPRVGEAKVRQHNPRAVWVLSFGIGQCK